MAIGSGFAVRFWWRPLQMTHPKREQWLWTIAALSVPRASVRELETELPGSMLGELPEKYWERWLEEAALRPDVMSAGSPGATAKEGTQGGPAPGSGVAQPTGGVSPGGAIGAGALGSTARQGTQGGPAPNPAQSK